MAQPQSWRVLAARAHSAARRSRRRVGRIDPATATGAFPSPDEPPPSASLAFGARPETGRSRAPMPRRRPCAIALPRKGGQGSAA